MSDLVRFTVSIERSLFEKLEKQVADSDYRNRSEFVRDLVRGYLVEQDWQSEKVLLGTISLLYDHHTRGLSEKLTHRQHHFPGQVLATTHIHLDEHNCLEVIILKGSASQVEKIAHELITTRNVKHGQLIKTTTGTDIP